MNFLERKFTIFVTGVHLTALSYVNGIYPTKRYKFCTEIEKTMEFFKYGFAMVADGLIVPTMKLELELERISYQQSPQYSTDDLKLLRIIEEILVQIANGVAHKELFDLFRHFCEEYRNEIHEAVPIMSIPHDRGYCSFCYPLNTQEDLKRFEQGLAKLVTHVLGDKANILDFDIEIDEEELKESQRIFFEVFGNKKTQD